MPCRAACALAGVARLSLVILPFGSLFGLDEALSRCFLRDIWNKAWYLQKMSLSRHLAGLCLVESYSVQISRARVRDRGNAERGSIGH